MNSQNLKASVSFVGDGTTNKFYFGFDYINKQFVKVQIGNEGQSLTYPSDYTVDDRSVVLKDTPAVGVAIRVYRETSSDRIVEWADGAFIKASQMTLENLQQLHLIEEAQDYPILNSLSKYPDGVNFNALGSRVINVSDPKDPQDAVTKNYMETVQGGFVAANTILVQEATKQASAAKSSQEAAKTSETNAHTSENNVEISHQKAKKWAEATDSPDGEVDTDSTTGKTQSSKEWALYSKTKAQESATSAMNAKSSETNAKTSETNAKASEDNACRYADSAYASVVTAHSWAEADGSPDGEDDSLSTTGKTKSAKGWAEQAKSYAGALNMSFIINTLLPVGSVYITENANFDPNTYWGVGTWVKIAINKVLQGTNVASKVGTTIDAGLPNITGSTPVSALGWHEWVSSHSGALSIDMSISKDRTEYQVSNTNSWGDVVLNIDASRSNTIYGSSDTVQPPAELVFMWKRIA